MSGKHHQPPEPAAVREARVIAAGGLVLDAIGLCITLTDSLPRPLRLSALVMTVLLTLFLAHLAWSWSHGRLNHARTLLGLTVLTGLFMTVITGATYNVTRENPSATPSAGVQEPVVPTPTRGQQNTPTTVATPPTTPPTTSTDQSGGPVPPTSTTPAIPAPTTTDPAPSLQWYPLTEYAPARSNDTHERVASIRIGSTKYPNSIRSKFTSTVDHRNFQTWHLNGKCTDFRAKVGKDADSTHLAGTGHFSVSDQRGRLGAVDASVDYPQSIQLNISGATEVTLADSGLHDEADNAWGAPQVQCSEAPGPPVAEPGGYADHSEL